MRPSDLHPLLTWGEAHAPLAQQLKALHAAAAAVAAAPVVTAAVAAVVVAAAVAAHVCEMAFAGGGVAISSREGRGTTESSGLVAAWYVMQSLQRKQRGR